MRVPVLRVDMDLRDIELSRRKVMLSSRLVQQQGEMLCPSIHPLLIHPLEMEKGVKGGMYWAADLLRNGWDGRPMDISGKLREFTAASTIFTKNLSSNIKHPEVAIASLNALIQYAVNMQEALMTHITTPNFPVTVWRRVDQTDQNQSSGSQGNPSQQMQPGPGWGGGGPSAPSYHDSVSYSQPKPGPEPVPEPSQQGQWVWRDSQEHPIPTVTTIPARPQQQAQHQPQQQAQYQPQQQQQPPPPPPPPPPPQHPRPPNHNSNHQQTPLVHTSPPQRPPPHPPSQQRQPHPPSNNSRPTPAGGRTWSGGRNQRTVVIRSPPDHKNGH